MLFVTNESEVKKHSDFALFCYATWCPFNQMTVRLLNKMESEYKIPFFAVDVDSFKTYIKIYKLEALPTTILFKDAVEVKRIVGMTLTKPFRTIMRSIYIGGGKDV